MRRAFLGLSDAADAARALAKGAGALEWRQPLRSGPKRKAFLIWGPNPSFDYYISPRLERAGEDGGVLLDARAPPPRDLDLRGMELMICRYAPKNWRARLEGARGPAALSLFLDDDFIAAARDPSLSWLYRVRLARDGVGAWPALARAGTRVFVSTRRLRDVMAAARPRVLTPAPSTIDLAARPDKITHRVLFHATSPHRVEHSFAAQVAARVARLAPHVVFDVNVPKTFAPIWAGAGNVELRPSLPWPAYRELAFKSPADLLLAPLADTPLNRARAPTKAIDAVRFGAAGLFSDLDPYRGLSAAAAGPLLPWDADLWARAIVDLYAEPRRLQDARLRLAREAARWREAALTDDALA